MLQSEKGIGQKAWRIGYDFAQWKIQEDYKVCENCPCNLTSGIRNLYSAICSLLNALSYARSFRFHVTLSQSNTSDTPHNTTAK